MSRSPGDRFDRYVVESRLGRGGMGEVWRATDPRLDRKIALKILPRTDTLDPRWAKARTRMLREARSAAALNHPNVVAVFDVGEVDDTPYIAMELVEGATLREYIGDASVPMRRRAQWVLEIARALAAAHQRGVIHRDVKPENVMVRHDGSLKVLDFGIARRVRVEETELAAHASSIATFDDELIGTVMYMAPEQFQGQSVDARADQFAWGIVALELLRGEHPWGSPKGSPIAVLEAILRTPTPAVVPDPELPAELAAAIARATEKTPDARFPSMDALLDAVEGASRLPPLRRGPASPTEYALTSQPVILGDLPPPAAATLPSGTRLADRYEVVKLLGRGGMGDVYEAIDTTDGAHVALKVVRADRSGDTRAGERFEREIDLARRVVHPNVARVLDARLHQSPTGAPPFLLLAMELLTGESLADLLARRGALDIDEARPIAREMVAALGAAHAVGVVHRDFKSANVILEPRAGGGVRVVVTDFGLARAMDAGVGGESNLSRNVVLLGTPAYMAPEQVAATAVDQRADIYSLGVVLFEMATGTLPFVADTPLEAALLRLRVAPPSPRAVSPTLDGRWNDLIVRCLARDPGDRFASAAEVTLAIDRTGTKTRRRWRWLGALGVAGLLAAAATTVVVRARHPANDAHASGVGEGSGNGKRRAVVSVLAIKNLSGRADEAWISAALGEMIATELATGEGLRIVPAERVAQATRDLALEDASSFTPETLARLGANLGTDYVIAGSYVPVGDSGVRADVTLQDVHTGATDARIAETGAATELPKLAHSLGVSLSTKLGVRFLTASQEKLARAAIAGNPQALEAFSEGEIAFREADYAGARAAFERTIAADPSYPLAHAALSQTLASLGDDARSLREAKIAFDSASGLSREQQLAVEARYRAAAKEWDRAAEINHALLEFFPDNLEYGVRYATSLDNGGKPAAALAAIDQLRKLPPPDGNDPRLGIIESIAADHAGDEKRSLEAARAAVPEAEARGRTATAADAHNEVAEGLWGFDDLDAALVEFERSKALYEKLGDKAKLSTALAGIAGIEEQRGEPTKAIPLAREALENAQAAGDRFRVGVRTRDVADMLHDIGAEKDAHALWIQSHDVFESIHAEREIAKLVGRLGRGFEASGDLAQARASFVEARDRTRAVSFLSDVIEEEWCLAELALDTGDLAEAVRAQGEGAKLVANGEPATGAELTLTLARIAYEKGDMVASRKSAEDARAAFDHARTPLGALRAESFLAKVALDDGRLADAEKLAREASDALHTAGYRGFEAEALAALATVLVAAHRVDEATDAITRAEALAPEREATALDVALARARVVAATPGGAARSSAMLNELSARAEKSGFVPRAREIRRLEASLRAKAPRP